MYRYKYEYVHGPQQRVLVCKQRRGNRAPASSLRRTPFAVCMQPGYVDRYCTCIDILKHLSMISEDTIVLYVDTPPLPKCCRQAVRGSGRADMLFGISEGYCVG